jgi:hypothetical protein
LAACGNKKSEAPDPSRTKPTPAPATPADAAVSMQQPPPAPLVWPAHQPPGVAYLLDSNGRIWMLDEGGKVSQVSGTSGAVHLVHASGGDVLALRRGGSVGVSRIVGARATALSSPKLRGMQVAADAAGDRVAVAAADSTLGKGHQDPKVSVLQNGVWSAPEAVAGVGPVSAVMLGDGDDLWITGWDGIARKHAGAWKFWKCPELTCTDAALAKLGTKPMILVPDTSRRFRMFVVDDHDELAVEMPKGVDWASNHAGRNGVLVETTLDGTIRARVGDETTSVRPEWFVVYGGTLDGSGRYWHGANRGLAVTDLAHETSVVYLDGAPLIAGAPSPDEFVVLGGGPSLPTPGVPGLAVKVTGALNLNGRAQAMTPFKVCPSMHDGGDPCARRTPAFSGTTDAKGAFELANVPQGSYDIGMYLKTTAGNSTWAVISSAMNVRAGAAYRAGTIKMTGFEYPTIR